MATSPVLTRLPVVARRGACLMPCPLIKPPAKSYLSLHPDPPTSQAASTAGSSTPVPGTHLYLARVVALQAVGMVVTTGSHQQLLKHQHHLLALDAASRRPCWNPWCYCPPESVRSGLASPRGAANGMHCVSHGRQPVMQWRQLAAAPSLPLCSLQSRGCNSLRT